MLTKDEYYLKLAVKEAKKAFDKNEVPVGAIIVIDGKVIAKAHNLKETKKNGLYHAEMIAIDKAMKKLNLKVLENATIYITLEPCLMCTGAIMNARIKRVCFAASEKKFGALGSIVDISNTQGFNHKLEVTKGIMENEVSELMKTFFKKLRDK